MLEFIDTMLEYDKNIRILGEMKPNEPMDLMYAPTTGHFLALGHGRPRLGSVWVRKHFVVPSPETR